MKRAGRPLPIMPVAVKNDDDIEDDDNDVQFLFVRSATDEVVAPPPEKQARFNPSNVLVAAHNVIYPDDTTQEGGAGVRLPWVTCNAESKSPYLLDLLEALRTTQAFGPLWTKHEADLISVFLGLSMATQDFFIRLCYRKLLWHRLLGVVNLFRRVVIDQATDCEPNSLDFDLEKEIEDYITDLREVFIFLESMRY